MNKINKIFHEELKAWPFVEALKIINKFGGFDNFEKSSKKNITFETGYGPSGLPHIGTFGEIIRTIMVQHSLTSLINCETNLITFSEILSLKVILLHEKLNLSFFSR